MQSTPMFFIKGFEVQDRKLAYKPTRPTDGSQLRLKRQFRGCSVPPMHFASKISKEIVAPSQKPVIIKTVIGNQMAPRGRLSVSALSGYAFDSLTGHSSKPTPRRASIAVPGGSNATIWKVGNRRPSSLEVTKASTPSRWNYQSLDRLKIKNHGNKSYLSGRDLHSVPLNFPYSTAKGFKQRSRSSFHETYDLDEAAAPSISLTPQFYSKRNVEKYASRELSAVPRKTKQNQFDDVLPIHEESLSNLRARTQSARDQLSKHRVLLDRYLPLKLGPVNDVAFEVETRYGELLARMPHLQPQKLREDDDRVKIPPYKPASIPSKSQKLMSDIANIPVQKSFTSKVSDTRKRARNVLCKIKGDPHYFDF